MMRNAFDRVANIVARVTGHTVEEIKKPISHGMSRPLFCYCAYIVLGYRQADIAAYLRLSNRSSVSRALKKSHSLQATNSRYREMLKLSTKYCK